MPTMDGGRRALVEHLPRHTAVTGKLAPASQYDSSFGLHTTGKAHIAHG